jgi:hypothetical protein
VGQVHGLLEPVSLERAELADGNDVVRWRSRGQAYGLVAEAELLRVVKCSGEVDGDSAGRTWLAAARRRATVPVSGRPACSANSRARSTIGAVPVP